MAAINGLYELESLFIEKLQEKYKLNIRDIKKAFARFDLDNNGLLDLHELGKGVGLFLNGVKDSQIQELVKCYDSNGDGKISYEEFLFFLQSRNAIAPDDGVSENMSENQPDEYSSAYDGGYSPRKGGGYADYYDEGASASQADSNYDSQPSSRGGNRDHRKKVNSMHGAPRPKTAPNGFNFISHQEGGVQIQANKRSNHPPRPMTAGSDLTADYSHRPGSAVSDVYSEAQPDNPQDLEARAKVYLTNLRNELLKQAHELRFTGQVKLPIAKKFSEMQESVARTILMKRFQPYTGMQDGRARERLAGVEFPDFARVLRSFTFPGTPPIRSEVIQFLFDLSSNSIVPLGVTRSSEPVFLNEEGRPVADIPRFQTLLFGSNLTKQEYIAHTGHAIAKPSLQNTSYTSTGAAGALNHTINEDDDPIDHAGRPIKSFVAQMNANRVMVGKGPVVMNNPSDIQKERIQQELLAVPLRFVSRKSRTVLSVPSNFEPNKIIPRSNSLPTHSLRRKYVFGLSTTRYSGNALFVLPYTPDVFTTTGGANNRPTSRHNNPHFLDPATVVYTSAALGVVHDLSTNQQVHFTRHTDDVTCLALSNDGRFAATGCLGKASVIHIWETNLRPPNNTTATATTGTAEGLILTIGLSDNITTSSSSEKVSNTRDGTGNAINGVGGAGLTASKGVLGNEFQRGVCAMVFSYDNKYLIAIGCDDNHSLGIYDLTNNGQKIKSSTTAHGIPPQIKYMAYCTIPQHTEYITREHSGFCDLFATAGDHHIRIWSFRRPTSRTDVASTLLEYKGLTIGTNAKANNNCTAAKCYTTCAFLPCEDKAYDLIAGGSNGVAYLWRKGGLITANQIMKCKITLMVVGLTDKVFCGGNYGLVKVLDGRTLTILRSFQLAGAPPGPMKPRPGSGSAVARGGSSSNKRASSAPRRPGSGNGNNGVRLTAKPSPTAAPSHPAGMRTISRTPGENILTGPTAPEVANTISDSEEVSREITGLAVVQGNGGSGSGVRTMNGTGGTYLLVTLATGKMVRVEVGVLYNAGGNPKTAFQQGSGSAGPLTPSTNDTTTSTVGQELLFFHTGPVYGLTTEVTAAARLCATVGEDKRLLLWDTQDCVCLARATLKTASRCVAMDRTNSFYAVGSTSGSVTVYFLTDLLEPGHTYYQFNEVAYRKDCGNEVTDLAYSPDNTMLAAGCRDDTIYLYRCQLVVTSAGNGRKTITEGNCNLQAYHRLKGHSSTITHLDWSYDSALLLSTCQAYELLCWDVKSGKQITNNELNIADIRWYTRHCVLGFDVMGIWPPYADGTDINAVDIHREKGLVVTGNDSGGLIRLSNYPCVVKHAPGKEYIGHSSHVMGVQFMRKGGNVMISVGGNDGAVMVFNVVSDMMDRDSFK